MMIIIVIVAAVFPRSAAFVNLKPFDAVTEKPGIGMQRGQAAKSRSALNHSRLTQQLEKNKKRSCENRASV